MIKKILVTMLFVIIAVGLFYGLQLLKQYQQKQEVHRLVDDLFEGYVCRDYDRMLEHLQWVYDDPEILTQLTEIDQIVSATSEEQKALACEEAIIKLEKIEMSAFTGSIVSVKNFFVER